MLEVLIILIFVVANIGNLLYLDRMRRGMEKRFRTAAHDSQQIKTAQRAQSKALKWLKDNIGEVRVALEIPNEETRRAFAETEEMLADPNWEPRFKSNDEALAHLRGIVAERDDETDDQKDKRKARESR